MHLLAGNMKRRRMDPSPIISAKKLSFSYQIKNRLFPAVKNINFEIYRGETLGLVGESGCGKTTVGKLLMHILAPSSGELYLNGIPYSTMRAQDVRALRQTIQMVYQDPYSSLNHRMTIEEIISEPLIIFASHNKRERKTRVNELLNLVGLDTTFSGRYPHQLSGGQRQRVVIARALAPSPKFLICDEPIAALDVSIQAQIINLLIKLQNELNLTYLFISHDLSIVKHLSNRVAVMYGGEIVEMAPVEKLYDAPEHPYTQALLAAIPTLDFATL